MRLTFGLKAVSKWEKLDLNRFRNLILTCNRKNLHRFDLIYIPKTNRIRNGKGRGGIVILGTAPRYKLFVERRNVFL